MRRNCPGVRKNSSAPARARRQARDDDAGEACLAEAHVHETRRAGEQRRRQCGEIGLVADEDDAARAARRRRARRTTASGPRTGRERRREVDDLRRPHAFGDDLRRSRRRGGAGSTTTRSTGSSSARMPATTSRSLRLPSPVRRRSSSRPVALWSSAIAWRSSITRCGGPAMIVGCRRSARVAQAGDVDLAARRAACRAHVVRRAQDRPWRARVTSWMGARPPSSPTCARCSRRASSRRRLLAAMEDAAERLAPERSATLAAAIDGSLQRRARRARARARRGACARTRSRRSTVSSPPGSDTSRECADSLRELPERARRANGSRAS